jgi:hypothetical protein
MRSLPITKAREADLVITSDETLSVPFPRLRRFEYILGFPLYQGFALLSPYCYAAKSSNRTSCPILPLPYIAMLNAR